MNLGDFPVSKSSSMLTAPRGMPPGDGPVLGVAACAKPAIPGLAAAPVRLFAVQNASARSEGLRERFESGKAMRHQNQGRTFRCQSTIVHR